MFDEPFPPGDPADIRALAARLQSDSDALSSQSQRARGRVDALPFEGPKASRFRDHVAASHARARELSNQMNNLAARLSALAAQVEEAQMAWHARRLAALQRGMR